MNFEENQKFFQRSNSLCWAFQSDLSSDGRDLSTNEIQFPIDVLFQRNEKKELVGVLCKVLSADTSGLRVQFPFKKKNFSDFPNNFENSPLSVLQNKLDLQISSDSQIKSYSQPPLDFQVQTNSQIDQKLSISTDSRNKLIGNASKFIALKEQRIGKNEGTAVCFAVSLDEWTEFSAWQSEKSDNPKPISEEQQKNNILFRFYELMIRQKNDLSSDVSSKEQFEEHSAKKFANVLFIGQNGDDFSGHLHRISKNQVEIEIQNSRFLLPLVRLQGMIFLN